MHDAAEATAAVAAELAKSFPAASTPPALELQPEPEREPAAPSSNSGAECESDTGPRRHAPTPPEFAQQLYRQLKTRFGLDKPSTRVVCDKAQMARLGLPSAPEAFVLEGDAARSDESAAFMAAFERSKSAGQLWLAKPATGSLGSGIVVFKDDAAVKRVLAREAQKRKRAAKSRSAFHRSQPTPPLVMQRYLMDPLLLRGVKFDLRVHVVVLTGADGDFRALFHRGKSSARFASGQWDASNLDATNHLTNLCLAAAKHEEEPLGDGSSRADHSTRGDVPLDELLTELASSAGIAPDTVLDSLRSACAECFRAFKQSLAASEKTAGAETQTERSSGGRMHHFGLDVILDSNLRSWLLEVNYSPAMRYDTDLPTRELVVDLLDLALRENLLDQESCWQVTAAASKGHRDITGEEFHWQPPPPPAADRVEQEPRGGSSSSPWHELDLEDVND